MKLVNKISISVSAIAMGLILCAGSVEYFQNKESLEKNIISRLEGTSEERKNHVETYLDMLQISVAQLSKSIILEQFLNTNRSDTGWTTAFDLAGRRLKKTKDANPAIYEFLLLDEKGLVVAASRDASIGQDKSADVIFIEGKTGVYIKDAYLLGKDKIPLIAVSAPLFDSKTGKFLGVLGARVTLDRLNQIMTDRIGLGQSGETFIVNKYGYLITPSRFIEDAFLKVKVSGQENYRMCRVSHDKSRGVGGIALCRDYRGVMVLGTHSCISQLGWVILTEIDETEAFAPLREMRNTFLIILLIVPLSAWLLGSYIARIITGPIDKLQLGTRRISAGDLDYRVGRISNDEIGALAASFDSMTYDLQKKTVSIEKLNEEIARSKSLEYALRQNEIKYKALYDSSADAIMLC